MGDQFCVRVQELAVSLVGAAASACRGAIVPYMSRVMPRLEQYLTMHHTPETQVLLTQSMATLGTLARAVGQQHFSKEFAEKCVNIGLELVKNNDDPDVRKCAFSLFGSVATVVKADMGAQLVGFLVDLMLKTIQNTEGLSLEMEGVKAVSIQNAFVEEKECALVALKDLSVECGPAFYSFLPQCYDEVTNLLDYPDYDVRSSAIEAAGYFLT